MAPAVDLVTVRILENRISLVNKALMQRLQKNNKRRSRFVSKGLLVFLIRRFDSRSYHFQEN